MSYTVCIPTAGTGTRLGTFTKNLNKSLVEINNKPIISHIIEKFDKSAKFVIPIGHKAEIVKNYLSFAHPDLDIITIPISPYEGPGSSLGTTLNLSRDYLNEPFIFCSCDTIVEESNFELDQNWLGWDELKDTSSYRTLSTKDEHILEIHEKLSSNSNKAYIGLAGIKDYEKFWSNFDNAPKGERARGEVAGIKLENMPFEGRHFSWFDTGNPSQLSRARQKLNDEEVSVLPKEDEKIWFVNSNVIKFSTDEDFIQKRTERSSLLLPFVPEVSASSKNMYLYKYIEGDVLSRIINEEIFDELLTELDNFWEKRDLNDKQSGEFEGVCSEFYQDKTYDRVNDYLNRYPEDVKEFKINGTQCSPIYDLLEAVDWHQLIDGYPVRFHGDLHFENIIYSSKNKKFTFLDWRQGFGGLMEYGDIYYDLAKLLHGMVVPHPSISKGKYSITESEDNKTLDIYRKEKIQNIEKKYNTWIKENGYSLNKVGMLCSLIFLNISSLHHHPYSKFLFSLGHYGLQETISKGEVDWNSVSSHS